jgi:hypothetical protein
MTKHLIELHSVEKEKLNRIVDDRWNGEPNNEHEALRKAVDLYISVAAN